ncbi:MAG: RHS repeat protein, partial [Planctomycetes bacterium]|nr:RHS repeat protein [Planctomycetota bacterium]
MAKPLPVWATLLLLAALAFADGARAAAPAQYEHDAAGRRVAVKLPNGVKTTYAHDAAGRLTRIESKS